MHDVVIFRYNPDAVIEFVSTHRSLKAAVRCLGSHISSRGKHYKRDIRAAYIMSEEHGFLTYCQARAIVK